MTAVAPRTLRHGFTLFADAHPKNHVANLKTVFRRYILPFLPGYQFISETITGKQLLSSLAKVPLKEFIRLDCKAILEEQLHLQTLAGKIAERTADNYLCDYDSFIRWLQLQNWYEVACGRGAEKYAPRLTTRTLGYLSKSRQGKGKDSRNSPYRLRKEQILPYLNEQLEKYQKFWTLKVVEERQDDKVRDITITNHKKAILLFLGWLINIEGRRIKQKEEEGQKLNLDEQKILMLLDNLSLELVENIKLLKKCVSWGINERGNGYGWAETLAKACLSAAKFLNAEEAPNEYRGVKSVDQIRIYLNQLGSNTKAEADAVNTVDKEMTHEQCIVVVERLRKSCTLKRAQGQKRSLRTILWSWQRYLITAILTYCPIRGREIRELELNKTLFKECDGYWLKLKPEHNKTKKLRELNLSEWLPGDVITDLDTWLTVWRPQAKNAIRHFDQWLAFWDFTQKDLSALPERCEQARLALKEASVKRIETKIRSLKNLIDIWQRSDIQSDHNYVFFSVGSTNYFKTVFRPYCDKDPELTSELVSHFGGFIKASVFRTTALLIEEGHPLFQGLDPKSTHPHFFRHIDSTELRRQEVSYKVLKAFHEGIGNSVAEGDRSYNLMAPAERTAAAARWWTPNEPQDDEEKMVIIKKLLFELPPEQRRIVKSWI